jgi:hypothetical protein
MWAALGASVGDARLDTISKDVPLEFSEDGEHAGERPSRSASQVEGFVE